MAAICKRGPAESDSSGNSAILVEDMMSTERLWNGALQIIVGSDTAGWITAMVDQVHPTKEIAQLG
jgi:hypothetical protein